MSLLVIDNNVIDMSHVTAIEYDAELTTSIVHLNGTVIRIYDNENFGKIIQKFLDLEGQTIHFTDLVDNQTNMDVLLDGIKQYVNSPMVLQAIKDPATYLNTLKKAKEEDETIRQMNFQFEATGTEVN